MEKRPEQRLREIQIEDGSTTSLAIRKASPCQQDDDSHDSKRRKYSGPELPEEIWCHIHSLMTLRDAARAACLSHAFLSSWKCHPNLIFDRETFRQDMDFTSRVNHILKKHLGIGVKTLKLDFSSYYDPKAYFYLGRWLQIAVTPGIEKLTLVISQSDAAFRFPCSILSDGKGSSIWHLHLVHCAFHPTASLGSFRSLTLLHLDCVRITGDELGYLFSSCVALERLNLRRCSKITYLKIPSWLQRLKYLLVLECKRLRILKNEAPNIRSFHFAGDRVEVSLGESLRLTNLQMICYRFLRYLREELPSSVPNLETLDICSRSELANTSMAFAPSKFLHLKHVGICITGAYDYFSLVSFLDAAPLLETFHLRLLTSLKSEDPSTLRRMPGYRHDKLQRVKISRFYSSKSLIELTSHILENSPSLECVTLDTTDGRYTSIKCSDDRSEKCSRLASPMDAHKAVWAIGKYIKRIVPSTVKLDVVEPCRRCYPVELSEKIWCHIHSLMTLQDAARVACVSLAFLRSWRCYPNLVFNIGMFGMLRDIDFIRRVDHILNMHSGIGLKTFELDFSYRYNPNAYKYLDMWLQIVVRAGIEKLTLVMPKDEAFHFPCSLLYGSESSIRYLHLVHCAFRSTDSFGCLRNLTVLHLDCVRITGDELGCLLSSCVSLEQLKLRRCSGITCLKIPSLLQQLSYLQVLECQRLRILKNEAPNIHSFHLTGDRVEVSLGESLRLKNLKMSCHRFLRYVCEELPSSVPNLETLSIFSLNELVNTTMAFAPSKFLHLKHVAICISGAYDYFSLVSLLDAAPSLETFDLSLLTDLESEDLSHLQRMPSGYRHDKLQRVKISRFYCSKSLLELTSHILENSASLERLTLDTTDGWYASINCSDDRAEKCSHLVCPMDAHKTVMAIGKYIKGIVPSTVKLDVVESCSRCYPVEQME